MAKKKGGKSKSSTAKTASSNSRPNPITDLINTEVIAEALSAANQPVLLKLCRLCEAKEGPFLNIFDADKVIAKKIVDLMPFGIEESDDLPHKICFRCSAKVEELYEFVQKCIKTQDSLRKAVGKMGSLGTKTKTRTLWEKKLTQSNMSNDDICNALIKKAMEGIKDIPMNTLPVEEVDDKLVLKKSLKYDLPSPDNEIESKKKSDLKKKDQDSTSVVKEEVEKKDQKVLNTRASRSSNIEPFFEGLCTAYKKTKQIISENNENYTNKVEISENRMKSKPVIKEEESALEIEVPKEEKPVETKPEKKTFDIMDHISMIKVNGVGVLFQCKLCNRNFLKKEVVLSHACAKNGGPKQELIPEYLPPNPPKIPVVKYINTKTDGLHSKPAMINEKPIVLDDDPPPSPVVSVKTKPKIGPASKVKRNDTELKNMNSALNDDNQISPNTSQLNAPTVQFPGFPSLNSRYKLVSGPNNTFTLVEEKVADNAEYVSSDESNSAKPKIDRAKTKGKSKSKNESSTNSKGNKLLKDKPIDVIEPTVMTPTDMPYPVGLIKRPVEPTNDYAPSDSIAFTTPAMKKQSYTIVQTGNPSKLLISTKPKSVIEEIPTKRARKQRRDNQRQDNSEQPFSVTLEDTTPPKDPGFFTFINVDPLLQPSYVLPTDNIIQESQISTSTAINNRQTAPSKGKEIEKEKEKDKYTCNMCSEQFSREKKLLAHIHSHYNKMDKEDQLREKVQRKRGRKS